eukprot:gnl/Hemi2/21008_TR6973_c0_g1_i1.p1 gnl/Hemi2/21008_TR6973_c0_g1~~gnl/Hemi2/21008_TR6973_c0_g1_i1.p1  ORF type:complete len:141 (-),score=36.15 gnl/Hemi2/21008_TR6973_c0_g1_i1:310-732(-)
MVAFARLYIGRHLLPFDPSLSLHDDPETAVTIAQAYASYKEEEARLVHLMGLDVPVIETLGYRVIELQDDASTPWFKHQGVWFDASLERTERYTLWDIPFFSQRLKSLKIFSSQAEVAAFIAPFKASQLALYQQSQQPQR